MKKVKTNKEAEAAISASSAPKRRGRPPGSKNKKTKEAAVVAEEKQMTSRLDQLKAEYEKVSEDLAVARVRYDLLMRHISQLEVLLSSFNALTADGKVELVKPEMKSEYWYIRALPTIKRFGVVSWTWTDSRSDHYRYAKGNMFLDHATAENACNALNIFLSQL